MLLYAACVLLLCCGPSGLVVRASDWCSEGLEFKSQLVPEFLWGLNLSLSLYLTIYLRISLSATLTPQTSPCSLS